LLCLPRNAHLNRIISDLPQGDDVGGCFDDEVLHIAGGAVVRMQERLSRFTPGLAVEVGSWLAELSRTGNARDYFLGGRSVLILLPRFLREACAASPDSAFESDIAYSTISAYYFVRLVDDVVDRAPAARPLLLPMSGVFHAEFQSTFARHFPAESAFWQHFYHFWFKMAEATVEQAGLSYLSLADFLRISAAKSGGAKIPLAAVCEYYGRPDLLQSWCDFFDAYAAWNQMQDDVFDWFSDRVQGSMTYFLSEARRRSQPGESVASWVLREGIEWGYNHAAMQMRELRGSAIKLGSDDLVRLIDNRQMEVARIWTSLRPQLPALAKLACVLEG
jgi:hypothetical protein